MTDHTDKMILQRYAPRVGGDPHAPSPHAHHGVADPPEAEAAEDLGAFGWLRGMRERAVMLELRKKDGNILAVGYGYLEKAEFDPSEGITLSIVGQKIKIKGRNLNALVKGSVQLFAGIARHRVPWVQEADEPASMEADDQATVIDKIEW